MFCYQCEQTAKGTGCTVAGVCGKQPDVAALQDLLLAAAKGIGMYMHRAGVRDAEIDTFTVKAVFSTITNVNFDPERLVKLIGQAARLREKAGKFFREKTGATVSPGGFADLDLTGSLDDLVRRGESLSISIRKDTEGEDVTGLKELITYGLKGVCAYLDHAEILGVVDEGVYASIHEVLNFLTESHDAGELTGMALKVGEINLTAMERLDHANTETYGHPEPTRVRVTPVKGKCILVSGHDLKDLEEILKQTEGKGINVYTHGEMLPTLAYPGLKKYAHLAGNYGSAWQKQREEFDAFPGAILMTTNCIQKPKEEYKGRIFTTDLVAWPGVTHIEGYDFTPVIRAALETPGFTEDAPEHFITVGFGRNAVLGVADKVIAAVKNGDIKHFFLIGGCDGAKPGRSYFTEMAKAVPDDCVILTLACGKYRFNKLEFGDIGGIPRLLDIGQCNDAYSAIRIAAALADAFGTDVNGLPLSMILSWYEQKAVAILLSLLHLGIKGIRLGPTLPAFVTPAVLNVLVENFDIKPITTVEEDLKSILG